MKLIGGELQRRSASLATGAQAEASHFAQGETTYSKRTSGPKNGEGDPWANFARDIRTDSIKETGPSQEHKSSKLALKKRPTGTARSGRETRSLSPDRLNPKVSPSATRTASSPGADSSNENPFIPRRFPGRAFVGPTVQREIERRNRTIDTHAGGELRKLSPSRPAFGRTASDPAPASLVGYGRVQASDSLFDVLKNTLSKLFLFDKEKTCSVYSSTHHREITL
jgi:hypothetical protein